MPRALRVCSRPGCPHLTTSGRCEDCRREADKARGTRHERGYGRAHTDSFRPAVLRRDPRCVCTDLTTTATHDHGPQCLAPSTVADHHPRDKRELRRLSLDDNDPRYGRGLCATCHNHSTANLQPGGWHQK